MKYYSTNKKALPVDAQTAVLRGLAEDGGLYMPESIPPYPRGFVQSLGTMPFPEIAFETAKRFLSNEVPTSVLQDIVEDAFDFPAPAVEVQPSRYVLELFHGPTLAFKDFGARFMARLMSYFLRNSDRVVTVLVATSGDTGSAVAHGFYNVDGIDVCLLYPHGKVSPLQEKQFATLGGNITCYEVDGVFDDCQRLVKEAFVDTDVTTVRQLASANSINIARLIPQSFYYAACYGQIAEDGEKLVFCIPSGNFGNLTAGLFAYRMGLPVQRFIAATNANSVVPEYLQTGEFKPRPSTATISNAMDVGNPSNFARMQVLFNSSVDAMREHVSGVSCDDNTTRRTIKEVYEETGYVADPHTAVGWYGVTANKLAPGVKSVVLGTAHPAKFKDVVEDVLEQEIPLPEQLAAVADKEVQSIPLTPEYPAFKALLLG